MCSYSHLVRESAPWETVKLFLLINIPTSQSKMLSTNNSHFFSRKINSELETTYDILFLILKQSSFHTPTTKQTAQSFFPFSPWKRRQFIETTKKAKGIWERQKHSLAKVLCLKAKNTVLCLKAENTVRCVQDILSAVLLLIWNYCKCLAPQAEPITKKCS